MPRMGYSNGVYCAGGSRCRDVSTAVILPRISHRIDTWRRWWAGANILRFGSSDVAPAFDLVVDSEPYNHLHDTQREAVGHEVSAVVTPDAMMPMLVWALGRATGVAECRSALPPASRGFFVV